MGRGLSPHRDRSWGSVVLGPHTLGVYGYSVAVVKGAKSAVKADSKKKAGKSSAKVTTHGMEQWKGTIVYQFLRGAYDEGQPGEAGEDEIGNSSIEAQLNELDPAGYYRGGPFPFSYPGLGPGAPKSIKIVSMTRPIEWTGEIGSVTMEWIEAEIAPGGSGVGGAATKHLSAGERAALEARLAYLAAAIVTKRVQALAAGTAAERAAILSEIQGLQNEYDGTAAQLKADAAPKTPPSETRNADKNAASGKSAVDQVFDAYKKATTAPSAKP